MKKRILLCLMFVSLFCLTGCGSNTTRIKKFIKENMPSTWVYHDGKVKVKSDNSVEIVTYNVADWSICALTTKDYISSLVNSISDTLDIIPSVTFVCYDYDNNISGKTTYSNLKTRNVDNIIANAKYYNSKNDEENSNPKDAYKSLCSEYNLVDVANNPDNNIGKNIKIEAKIDSKVTGDDSKEIYVGLKVTTKLNNKELKDKTIIILALKEQMPAGYKVGDTYTFYGEIIDPGSIESSVDQKADIGIYSYVIE